MEEKKVAVLIASGFEEGETLTIVDIIRRANITCHLIGFEKELCGAHDIQVVCDDVISEAVIDYDMVVLPGGYGNAQALRDSDLVIHILKEMDKQGKFIGAMCAAPIALERAGVLEGRNYTAYRGYDQKIHSGNYLEDIVVRDGNLLTSRGPATVYAYSYALVDALGGDSEAVKKSYGLL